MNTFVATAGAVLSWAGIEAIFRGKASMLGAASGMVAGLVAVTPAAGFIGPMSAIALGGIAAVPSWLALQWRAKTSLDDSLDVVAAHGVGGTVGAILTGVFAQKALNGVADGLLFGNAAQVGIQVAAIAAAAAYSGVMSFVLLKVIGAVLPLRASIDDQAIGLDLSMHGEEAYIQGGGIDAMPVPTRPTLVPALAPDVALAD